VIGGEDDEKGKWVVVATGGWGVTEYLHLDWMDDKTDRWMEKASRPRCPLHIVILCLSTRPTSK
jgi:hypothetical protein